jgi:hypothetical protein
MLKKPSTLTQGQQIGQNMSYTVNNVWSVTGHTEFGVWQKQRELTYRLVHWPVYKKEKIVLYLLIIFKAYILNT